MIHSEETKRKISKTLKRNGIKPTVLPSREQCISNLGKWAKKGATPWNKDTKGLQAAWNKGMEYDAVKGEKNGNWKGGLSECVDCGMQITNRSAKRCMPCNKLWQRGENIYNWKGGKSITRATYEYKQWALSVYKRDHFHCMFCGKHCGGDIQAHHIKRWIEYKSLRYEVSNGLTLCFNCHKKTRNKEQYYELLCQEILSAYKNPNHVRNLINA